MDDDKVPILVEGTKEELGGDVEQEIDYKEFSVGDGDICIQF